VLKALVLYCSFSRLIVAIACSDIQWLAVAGCLSSRPQLRSIPRATILSTLKFFYYLVYLLLSKTAHVCVGCGGSGSRLPHITVRHHFQHFAWLKPQPVPSRFRYRYSFICQGTSTRRQRSDLFGLPVKLPPVTTSLTTQR